MRPLVRIVVNVYPLTVGGEGGDSTVFQYWSLMYQRKRWLLLASSFQIWRMRAKPTVSRSSKLILAKSPQVPLRPTSGSFRQTMQDPRSLWSHATPSAKGHGEETPASRFARSVILRMLQRFLPFQEKCAISPWLPRTALMTATRGQQ